MLLCIDVVNSESTFGAFDGEHLVSSWRLSTERRRTADEWGLLLHGLLTSADLRPESVTAVCVSSTVPVVTPTIRHMLEHYLPWAHAVVVGPGVRSGLPMLVDNPREVGTDRVANVVGAVSLVGAPCVVVDCGLATTFDAVDSEGRYLGGAIAPGVDLSVDALRREGAQLRQVELRRPRSVVGKNTVEALQAGAVFGFSGLVDAIVTRMVSTLEADAGEVRVVATGDVADATFAECSVFTDVEPSLTLNGLRLIYDRNRPDRDVVA